MGPGFKYHVVTVAAIFFALTIGLVVGSLYVSPQLSDRQTSAIRDLQTTLKNDVTQQKQQLAHYREFVEQTKPVLLRNRLSGASVALIQTGDYPETMARVRETLLLAGAKISSETLIEREFNRADELLNPTLMTLNSQDPKFPTTRSGLCDLLVSLILGLESNPEGVADKLAGERLVHFEPSSDFTLHPRYVIFVAGSRSEGNPRLTQVDQPLLTVLLQKPNVTVAACEPREAASSDIRAYREMKLDLTTVDNADQDIGACALVFALRGDKDTYGVKETANRLLPPSLMP